ncbi:hypothetical protein COT72_01350 [archaeon CG10_big_fil_rev_8_21_14_0_10_43_11]|nr:MAG: hypothetical protein COT72_01350 [archaeon CG10_big_fil_rev_8_21_14_0_10_43_11]
MGSITIIQKEPLTIAEVQNALSKRADAERNYEQKLVWEHVSKFKKLGVREARKLVEELQKLELRRLKDEHIIQIVDVLPKNLKELKSIFATAKFNLHEDEYKQIIDVVKNYV